MFSKSEAVARSNIKTRSYRQDPDQASDVTTSSSEFGSPLKEGVVKNPPRDNPAQGRIEL